MVNFVDEYLAATAAAFVALRGDIRHADAISAMAATISATFHAGGKLLICGNGGSAADAQHIAAEFVSRLMYDRDPLPAVALTTDSSALTAIGNDYGFEHVFERQVRALGRPGDILLAISTSGRSPNVIAALGAARDRHMGTLGFAGETNGPMTTLCDFTLNAPSNQTAIIQQVHITVAHAICALVERAMFPRD